MNKDVEALIRAVKRQGFTVRLTGANHYQCTAPDGQWTSVPQTPRGGKSIATVRAKLRRIGAQL